MRYDTGHKNETHRRILNVAGEQFRKNGIASVGLATIMKEAGLTNGAFYAHFKSKEALLAEVLSDILDQREMKTIESLNNGIKLEHHIKEYLSLFHRDNCESGCPTAALISELVTHSKSTRKVFTERIEKTFVRIASQLKGEDEEKSRIAISLFSLMIGALQLSRAMTDKKLSEDILKSATVTALKMISA